MLRSALILLACATAAAAAGCDRRRCPSGTVCRPLGDDRSFCVPPQTTTTTARSTTTTRPPPTTSTAPVDADTVRTCAQPKHPGEPCEAARPVPSWAFNRQAQQCEIFEYAGCGGNANRFSNRQACLGACAMVDACPVPVARSTPVPENCESRLRRDNVTLCYEYKMECTSAHAHLADPARRRGECPKATSTGRACRDQCSADDDCRREGYKCCETTRCKRCVAPERGTFEDENIERNALCSQDVSEADQVDACAEHELVGFAYTFDGRRGACRRLVAACANNTDTNVYFSRAECEAVCVDFLGTRRCPPPPPLAPPPVGCRWVSTLDEYDCDQWHMHCDDDEITTTPTSTTSTTTRTPFTSTTANGKCGDQQCRPCERCLLSDCGAVPQGQSCKPAQCVSKCDECSTCTASGQCLSLETPCAPEQTCDARLCRRFPRARCQLNKCGCRRTWVDGRNAFTDAQCGFVL